jgi:hypothetical protein
MVRENLNGVLGLTEEMAVVGECVDDRIEFLVRAVPSFLTVLKLMMEEQERMPAVLVFLFHGAGVGNVGGVGGESNRLLWVKGTEEDIISDCGNDFRKGGSMELGDPFPRDVFLEEIIKAGGGIGVMGDEAVVETNYSEETAEFRDPFWWVDVTDTLDLVISHADTLSTFNSVPEEVTLFPEPFTFMGFETESVFLEGLQHLEDLGFVVFEGAGGVYNDIVEVSVAEDAKVWV